MKRKTKIGLISAGLIAAVFAASSCTANFCNNEEKSRMAFAFEPGVSTFHIGEVDNGEQVEGTNVWQVVSTTTVDEITTYNRSAQLNAIISKAKEVGSYEPSEAFFKELDLKVFNKALELAALDENISFDKTNLTESDVNKILHDYGFVKFYDFENDDNWSGFDKLVNEIRTEDNGITYEDCPTLDFIQIYKSTIDSLTNQYRSCITVIPGDYGSYGTDEMTKTIHLNGVTWKEAWGKGGHLIEGLVVFPVGWLLDKLANAFAHGDIANYTNGVPQILSLLLVTIIVRLFIFLVTIKSTLSQQKMSAIQPELAKIQEKYPNSNTSQAQKQRLAEEQMRVYKKNGINPLSPLLTIIVQFPVFIGVWGAMTGSAVLSTGAFLNLDLSQSIWECLKMGPKNHVGWWTALVLIILMSVGQFFSMKVPQWMQKAQTKKVARLGKNPAQKQQNKTANIVSYVMLIMIIFMGFTLPAAMGVYWFIGAIVSLIQTVVLQLVNNKKQKNRRN